MRAGITFVPRPSLIAFMATKKAAREGLSTRLDGDEKQITVVLYIYEFRIYLTTTETIHTFFCMIRYSSL